eukprot:84522_1
MHLYSITVTVTTALNLFILLSDGSNSSSPHSQQPAHSNGCMSHPYPDCRIVLKLPCRIRNHTFVPTGIMPDTRGTYGVIQQAYKQFDDGSINRDQLYSVKFALHQKVECRADILNETLITRRLYKTVAVGYKEENLRSCGSLFTEHDVDFNWPPTIQILTSTASRSNRDQTVEYAVMVMHHHPYGDLHRLHEFALLHMRQNPSGFVWKMLWDLSYVLNILNNEYRIIDGDVKLANIMVNGDLSDFKSTTFIKIDYGVAVNVATARKHLSQSHGRYSGFCSFGTHSTPMDVKVMYGNQVVQSISNHNSWNQNMDAQIEQDLSRMSKTLAAKKYGNELESKDILCLSISAVAFYNKLNPGRELPFRVHVPRHTEKDRRELMEYNWRILNERYNGTEYKDHSIAPRNIEVLLIKMQWLAHQQLPENDYRGGEAGALLNWKQFRLWLKKKNIYKPVSLKQWPFMNGHIIYKL